MTVGVIGLGPRGRAHLDSWLALPDVHVVGAADHDHGTPDPALAAPLFTDHGALLRAAGPPDVVSVAISGAAHVAVTADLLAAGVGVVVVEKPVAPRSVDAHPLTALADAHDRIAVCLQESFHRDVRALARTGWDAVHITRVGREPARAHPGLLLELAIHSLHLAATFAPGPLRVTDARVEDTRVDATLRDPNGFTARITCAWGAGVTRRLDLDGAGGPRTIDLVSGPQRGPDAPLARLLADAAEARRAGRPPRVGLAAGLTAQRLAEDIAVHAAAHAAATGTNRTPT